MKTWLTLLLAGSLTANLALAVIVLLGRPAAERPASPVAKATPVEKPSAPAIDADVWPSLASSDLPQLVGRLRDAGFPPEVVRAVTTAQIREQQKARLKAVEAEAESTAFWKNRGTDLKSQAAMREIYREQRALLRQVLGADAESTDPLNNLYLNRSFTFLSPEKAVDVRQLLQDFDERRSDIFSSGFNQLTDRTKLAALEKEQQDALARLLSPAELHEYNLRASNTANGLREQLSAFNPSEAEFRALFALRQEFLEKFPSESFVAMNQEEMRRRSEAEKALNDQFKATLTPERSLEYDRSTDYNYRRTSQLVSRLELSPDTTDRLWQVQKDFERRRMESARAATPEQRVQVLADLQREAIAALTPILGNERNVEAYKNYGGSWLQSFTVRPGIQRRP